MELAHGLGEVVLLEVGPRHRVAGAVKAETTNGAVDIDLTSLPAGSDLCFESTNGGVHVRLPWDVRLSVDAETTNGRVKSNFAVASRLFSCPRH